MGEKQSVLKEFLQLVAATFTCATLAMSIAGWFIGDAAEGTTAVFSLGNVGLSYQTIFQLFILAVINGGISLFISMIFKNRMLLWQLIVTMFACLVACGILAVIFRWIPLGSWEAWLWFAASFVGMFIIIAAAMVIRTTLADKKYEKLLSDYKTKQEQEKSR